MVLNINDIPDNIRAKILQAEEKTEKSIEIITGQEIKEPEANLEPWIHTGKEEVVDLTLEEFTEELKETEQPPAKETMPLPKYFQDLFDEFSTLN